jgi:hypothetical protein
MNSPGIKNLGDAALAAINAATTRAVITSQADAQSVTRAYRDGLEGMLAATIAVNFVYGGGGTSMKVIVETSDNQGATWTEVARFAFTTASKESKVNLSGLTPAGVYVPAALSDDTVKDGILGTWWRASILTVGTYTGNTSVAVRMIAR